MIGDIIDIIEMIIRVTKDDPAIDTDRVVEAVKVKGGDRGGKERRNSANLLQMSALVRDVLERAGLFSVAAHALLMATGEQESGFHYVVQLGKGPARSFWQVEPTTAVDVCKNFLAFKPELRANVARAAGIDEQRLVEGNPITLDYLLTTNLALAVLIARLCYFRRKEPMPDASDKEGMARYWKQWYNTPGGHGTEEQFLAAWDRINTALA